MSADGVRLLVSVRDVAEALAALEGGAHLIDVKEPNNGPLGMADVGTIWAVAATVGGRAVVSAALGELSDDREGAAWDVAETCSLLKWGLAGWDNRNWRYWLDDCRAGIEVYWPARVVACAYADSDRANSPEPLRVADHAATGGYAALLIDTFGKDGSCLFDWLDEGHVGELIAVCRAAGVRVALAGSLGLDHLDAVARLQPDWLAVRGAVCEGGRGGTVRADKVSELGSALWRRTNV